MKRNRKLAAALLCIMMFSTGISGRLPVQAEDAQNIPVYRLYNPNTGEHLLTCKESERENLIILGWHDEGIGFYETAEGDPVYRLYNPNGSEHHYTCSEKEVNKLVKLGWRDEGICWHSDDSRRIPLYRVYNGRLIAGQHHYTTSSGERDSLVANSGWRSEGIGWYGAKKGVPLPPSPGGSGNPGGSGSGESGSGPVQGDYVLITATGTKYHRPGGCRKYSTRPRACQSVLCIFMQYFSCF